MKPIQSSFKEAEMVRRAINRLNTSTKLMQNGYYSCFDNCREQGFVLQIWGGFNIAFTENRNSDDIVVYCYKNIAFPGNLPKDDEDWKDKTYFNYKDYEGAARYVLERAEKFLADKEAEEIAVSN